MMCGLNLINYVGYHVDEILIFFLKQKYRCCGYRDQKFDYFFLLEMCERRDKVRIGLDLRNCQRDNRGAMQGLNNIDEFFLMPVNFLRFDVS